MTANGLAPGWLDDPDRVGNETAACAFLDTSARPPRLRRAACSSRFAVLCMSSSERPCAPCWWFTGCSCDFREPARTCEHAPVYAYLTHALLGPRPQMCAVHPSMWRWRR